MSTKSETMEKDSDSPSVDGKILCLNYSTASDEEKKKEMINEHTTILIENEQVVKSDNLDELFKQINMAIVQTKCLNTIRDKSSESLDSDDDSTNDDESTLSLNSELKSESLSELMWSTDDEGSEPSKIPQKWTSELNLRSQCYWELMWLTDFNKVRSASMLQLFTTTDEDQVSIQNEEKINVNDIDVVEAENDTSVILLEAEPSVAPKWRSFLSLSELMWSTDDEGSEPSKIPQKWTSELNLRSQCYWELMWLTDFNDVRSASMPQLFTTTDEDQVSIQNEEKINVNDIDVVEAENDTSVILLEAEPSVVPKRRSFLSTFMRRILSVGRKLCCCGGGGRKSRKRRSNDEPGKL